jgi:ABC-type transport system involved in cytochrome bd biosynthesis fused ATPase/permease subunit
MSAVPAWSPRDCPAAWTNPLNDRATASVDSQTEALIQQALKALLAGRTALVVAHRLSTVQNADKILVLKKGRIVEQGTHAELIRQRGLYAHLYDTQFAAVKNVKKRGLILTRPTHERFGR